MGSGRGYRLLDKFREFSSLEGCEVITKEVFTSFD
jgi:hypothetical protein